MAISPLQYDGPIDQNEGSLPLSKEHLQSLVHALSGRRAAYVDYASVRLLEGLMPQYSSADQDRIVELMENRCVFPAIAGEEERRALLNQLLARTGRILSLNTLIHDRFFWNGLQGLFEAFYLLNSKVR